MSTGPRGLGALVLAGLGCFLVAFTSAHEASEYRLKAEFLERFTHFVRWPPEAMPTDPDEALVIGVLGKNPFGSSLIEISRERRVDGHPIEVREIEAADEAKACHVVFISSIGPERLTELLAETRGAPVLTVADTEGFGALGVAINLFVEEGRVGFEVNEAAARVNGLELSSKLLRLARRVGEDAP